MNDPLNHRRDQLAADAAGYEETLQPGSTVEDDFETQHPGLAKTVRMLNTVFRSEAESTVQESGQKLPQLTQIGRFTVERCLGSGGFGSVWLGHDPVLKRDVAIKVAHVGVHAHSDLQERFKREAHLAGRLHHPNIIPVFESDVDEGRLFIVSEYCDGQNLAQWLAERDEHVAPVVAARLVRQLADAADHAHRQGLIHRDIKPANVLLQIDETSAIVPRLTDFGLARDLASETSSTRTGVLVGTTEYMSPEQASGNLEAQGAGSDIFSLGVLLYRLLTDVTPFDGQSDFEIIQQIISGEPVAPSRRQPGVSRDLSSICLKCLEKQPERRYLTAAELRDDLDRFLRGEPTVARPITTINRIARWAKRSPTAAGLVFVLLASLTATIAGMGVYLRQVEEHAQEISKALEETRKEREVAKHARDEAAASSRVARRISYRSDMRLAFDLWERRRIHPVREILERQRPEVSGGSNGEEADADLRGVEWFALAADFRAKYREIGRHEGGATECVLNRDQTRAYSTGVDGVVRVWEVQSGELLNTFGPNIGEIHSLALSPDESTLAIGGKPRILDLARVVLLDAATGKRRKTWQTHKTTIESISFSPDGKWLAAGSRYEPVQLTRLADSSNFILPANRRNRSISFSSDSQFVSIAASETHFAVYRLNEAEPTLVHRIKGVDNSTPYFSCFAPGLHLLANASPNNNYISLTELTDPPVLRALATRGHDRSSSFKASCVGFSPGAKLLTVGDEAGSVHLWKPGLEGLIKQDVRWHDSYRRIEPVVSLTPHVSRVTSVVATDESTLISSGEDGRVALTSPFATGAAYTRWEGIQVNDAELDGDELLLACEDSAIRRYLIKDSTRATQGLDAPATEVEQRHLPEVIIRAASPIRCVALSPNRDLIAIGTHEGGVHLYRHDTREPFHSLVDDTSEASAVRALAFSASGLLLASTGENGFFSVYDTTTGETILSHAVGGIGQTISFLSNDDFLACGGNFEGIQILDITTGTLSQTVTGENTNSSSVSPDGQWLASAHSNGTVQTTNLTSGMETRIFRDSRTSVESTVFSPDSRTVISLNGHGVLQFTDVAASVVLGSLKLPQHDWNTFVHCSDKLLVTIANDDAPTSHLYVWHIGE